MIGVANSGGFIAPSWLPALEQAGGGQAATGTSGPAESAEPPPPDAPPEPPPPPRGTRPPSPDRIGGVEDLAWAGVAVAARAATLGIRVASRALDSVRKPEQK